MTKYPIELAREQREKLEKLIRRGKERAQEDCPCAGLAQSRSHTMVPVGRMSTSRKPLE